MLQPIYHPAIQIHHSQLETTCNMNCSRRCCTSWTNVLGRWTNKQKLITQHDQHVGIPSFTDWAAQSHKPSLRKVCFIEEMKQSHPSRCNLMWQFQLQFMLHLGTSCNCYSSSYILELLTFMLHVGTATVHVTSWNFFELLQFMLHLGTATVHATSWNCYSSCYILEFLWTAPVHVTSLNCYSSSYILELLGTPTVKVTYWNRYSSCYILELHILELLQFILHLEGRVTSSWTTPGETVYHIGCHCFTWEKLRTVTDYSKQKCTRYCSRMAKLRAPILFSRLSHDISPIDADSTLSCKAKRKTKLITCTVEQVTGCWWKSLCLVTKMRD
jgi:hypothetical protein